MKNIILLFLSLLTLNLSAQTFGLKGGVALTSFAGSDVEVIDKNTGLNQMGFTSVNIDEKARLQKEVNSDITCVLVLVFLIGTDHWREQFAELLLILDELMFLLCHQKRRSLLHNIYETSMKVLKGKLPAFAAPYLY